MKITLDTGEECELVRQFTDTRAIILFNDAYVLVDRVDADTWELSGEPARENEKPTLAALVAAMKDEVIVTKD